ncbi:MAG TPA: hypothetical protein VE690_22830 [Rhodopila sp.]|nr:hypothetical protein [Rhodopila sp.]
MLSPSPQPGADLRPLRHWKTVSPADAARMIRSGATIGVSWLGDPLAAALEHAFREIRHPRDLTVVYATAHDAGRNHGLNLLAREGLVRRVVGGQWHPVARLQMLAAANRIEAYSLPVGVIHRLFRDIADGLPGHLSRSGLGTFADPRHGGGRLNRRTREQLVRLVQPAGDDALLYRGFPIDVGLLGVGFMANTAAIAMSREAVTIARAVRRCGGTIFAQTNRVGTLEKLPPSLVEAPDTLVDYLIAADPRDRSVETFAPLTPPPPGLRRLTH